jgi:hypothetical protein
MESASEPPRSIGEKHIIDAIYEWKRKHCTMCLTCLDEMIRVVNRVLKTAEFSRSDECAQLIRNAAEQVGSCPDPRKLLLDLAKQVERL